MTSSNTCETIVTSSVMMASSETVDVASEVSTLMLIAQNDAAIDLTTTGKAATALAENIRDSYLNSLLPLLGALPRGTEDIAIVFRTLIERLATLEADLFLIKSCLVANQRFVMGEAAKYVDPLMALEASWPAYSGDTNNGPRLNRLSIPLGPTVLGQGWHSIESRPDGSFWRWSGPGTRSTLLLPRLGSGQYRIEWNFEVMDQRQLEGAKISVNGADVGGTQVAWHTRTTGKMSFFVEVPTSHRSSYLFLEIDLSETIAPAEMGRPDGHTRRGMGLGLVTLELGMS